VTPRTPIATYRAATGDLVVVGDKELDHAARHFLIPRDLLLGLVARVLLEPTDVFVDDVKHPHEYRLFYRLEDGRYLLAIVKVTTRGHFFASMYPTGKSIRPAHRKFRRLQLP
jgi:phage-Barnase-EndoU-ColicinE5/D-RelE like nuclease2